MWCLWQVVTCKTQYLVSWGHATVRRVAIFSLKTFLRVEKFYSAAVELPAKGAAINLLVALGLISRRPPSFAAQASASSAPAAAQERGIGDFFSNYNISWDRCKSWAPSEVFAGKRKRANESIHLN